MKLGSKKIWHFSHLPGKVCEYEYERESTYHLTGKLQLYYWLIKQGITAELEKYDPIMRQKPDIVFEYKGKTYAIEFQCSVIPEEVFIKRTETYKANGYTPIWIAAESLIRRSGANTVSLSSFLYLFMNRPGQTWMLTAFCPVSSQFIHLHNTVPLSSRKTITNMEVKSIHNATVEDLIDSHNKNVPFLKQWKNELQKYITRFMQYPGAMQNDYLQELYRNRLNVLRLPPEIGIPVPATHFIETAPVIWQSYIFLDLLRPLKTGELINRKHIYRIIEKRINRKKVQLRLMPLAGKGDYKLAIDDYISLLTLFSVLEKISTDEYKMNRELMIAATMDEQQEAVDSFYKEYGKIIESFFYKSS